MFFLLRMIFWMTVVVAFLPNDGAKSTLARSGVMAVCGQAGVRMSHDVLRAGAPRPRSMPAASTARSPAANLRQGTLTDADLAPAWRGPPAELHKKHGA
jgi:hypothetical protein